MITREVKIGNVVIGGQNPVMIQSMCAVKTYDVEKVVQQANLLYDAGAYGGRHVFLLPDGDDPVQRRHAVHGERRADRPAHGRHEGSCGVDPKAAVPAAERDTGVPGPRAGDHDRV
ncbi:MAG: flavodoxin-dependent (E)-4-hydroxy-3-methylbut-2-enyl-diphosphate synthase [Lachnospiraceae bacterium]|nr:flavodoxin-dependent (E)-4-hydroxy-3-methylbut-2-enyl-diphosphate synthase [Lachnospiraceae bacterium]